MKRILSLTLLSLLTLGCGATADRHVVTLSDVDEQLAHDHGADLRWANLAEQHDGFDRDTVSEAAPMITWTSFCESNCTFTEHHYSAVLEEVAHTAFVVNQLRQLDEQSDRAEFRRLGEVAQRLVSSAHIARLERRLDALKPDDDFTGSVEQRRAADEALEEARAQLASIRRALPVASIVVADLAPTVQPVTPAWNTPTPTMVASGQ